MNDPPLSKPPRSPPPRAGMTDEEWEAFKARRAAEEERLASYDGDILVNVEGSRRPYGVGERIPLGPHRSGAAVTVTTEDKTPLAAFYLPEADGDDVELVHPGPPKLALSVSGNMARVQREAATGDLALFDDARWLRCHWVVALVLAAGWTVVGAQVMLIETVHGSFGAYGYVYAVVTYLLGTIPGALVLGRLADRIGRRPVYTATAAIYAAAGVATALYPPDPTDPLGVAALRFFVGVATGGEYVVLSTTLQELMPKRRRGWACLAVNGAFWLGLAAVNLIPAVPDRAGPAVVKDHWETMFWTVGVLGVALLGLRLFLPESPRWLVAHNRKDRLTERMLEEIRSDQKRRSARPAAASPPVLVPARVPLGRSVAGLMWGEYRRQTLVCLALICSQAFFYNAFPFRFNSMLERLYGGVEGPISSDHLAHYIAAANFAGPLLLGWFFDGWGRKPMIWASYTASACLLFGVAVFLLLGWKPANSFHMTIAWAVVFFFTSTAASSAYLTLGESFPVEIRATAFSLLFGFGMLSGVLGSFLYGWCTGDLQHVDDVQQQARSVEDYERLALAVLGVAAAAGMAAAAVVEKAFGIEYARWSLEKHAPPLSAVTGVEPAAAATGAGVQQPG